MTITLERAKPEQVQTLVLPKNFDLSPDMEKAIKAGKQKKSLFITGRAGTGKSTLLTYLRKNHLSKNHVVVAPTGVAAINVGGMTIHKFFGFQIDVTFEFIESDHYRPRNQRIMRNLKTLIIDEISMVRADLLDCVDRALRKYGPRPDKPFGGVQIIFVGDLYQLPPIVTNQEIEFIDYHYDTPYFFSSYAYRELQKEVCVIELEKIYRQQEKDFIKILNAIRVNQTTPELLDRLNERVQTDFEPSSDQFYITLTATNELASKINQSELAKINAPLHKSIAHMTGSIGKKEFPAEIEIFFKVGSQIMMLNNDSQGRWVNGTLATIKEINLEKGKRDPHVVIEIAGQDELHYVQKHEWEILRPRSLGTSLTYDIIGSFTQFPFMLAWAVTIHKSQGKTFDNVIIDLTAPTFAAGQLYVALSRCTTLAGTVLKQEVDSSQIIVDEKVSNFKKFD